MKTIKQRLGDEGEKLAFHYLRDLGLKILETNWRFGRTEIDIIAGNDEELIFIEVKTRATDFFGRPEGAVKPRKEMMMADAAFAYLNKKDLDLPVRFDIIGIILNEHQLEIKHIPNAFLPGVF